MNKQVTCIDILRISNKLKIPINELTDEDIQTNIQDDELINKDIQTNIINDKVIPKNNVDENLNKKYMITMTFNFLKYLSK